MLVRRFSCVTCGAVQETSPSALVVMCRHCGSFVGIAEEAIYRGESFATAGRQMICGVGTLEAARGMARLGDLLPAMETARANEERDDWRRLAEEYYSLVAIIHPACCPEDGPGRLDWLKSAVAFNELSAFDAAIKSLQDEYNGLAARLTTSPNALETAREMYAAAQQFVSACLAHPDMEAGIATEGAARHAREMVRYSVNAMAMILGEGVVGTICRELLGDSERPTSFLCPGCGAPVSDSPCQHCGSSFVIEREDPWLGQTVAIFRAALPELAARGRLDSTEPVLAAMAYLFIPRQSGHDLSPSLAAQFLHRALPWLPWQQVIAGVELYRQTVPPGSTDDQFIDDVMNAAQPWSSDPSTRPSLPPPKAPPSSSEPFIGAEDPWVIHAIGLWAMGMVDCETVTAEAVLSFCLTPFFQGSPISCAQGLAFIEAVAPELSPSDIAAAANRLRQGFDEGLPLTGFLDDLVAYIGDRKMT